MAVRGASVSKRFDAIKKANPGMSDSDAMEKAIAESSSVVAKERKASDEPKKKKLNWAQKLKMGVTKQMSSKAHSPAGRKHRAKEGY